MSGRTANVSGVMSLLGAFVAAAVMMGLLSAGLFMPAVGAAGATARSGVDLFDSLPSEFTTTPLSEQSKILAADGSELATPYDENRVIVPLADIAPVMRTAQVAIEDHRFFEHGGVDLQGIMRAFISNRSAGEVTGGGSTLTQQYVKITLQENALRAGDTSTAKAVTAQSYARKIQELKYAVQLEKTLTKDQILEGYLNLVYYGDRAYGVEAAARHYFNKSAKDLVLTEAALIAGLTQNPGTTDPINYPEKATARRNVVLDRMHELKLISDVDWQTARAVKLSDILHPTTPKNSCQESRYPYFCDYVIAWLKQDPSLDGVLGKTQQERNNAIYRGGLTIQTTLEPAMMDMAREELTKRVPVGNSAELGAASAILDTKTGAVKAIVQNTDYNNNATESSADDRELGRGLEVRRLAGLRLRLDHQGVRPRDGDRERHISQLQRACQGGWAVRGSGLQRQRARRRMRPRRLHLAGAQRRDRWAGATCPSRRRRRGPSTPRSWAW